MNYLTLSEHQKIREITQRLESLQSPVLRLQAILQFSQIVDILAIGDSAQPLHNRIMDDVDEIDGLQDRVYEYQQKEQSANKATEDAPKHKPHSPEEQAQAIGSVNANECDPAQTPTACAGRSCVPPDDVTDSDDVA
jgi:hypothetical protein